jgi:hypothetical protein
MCRGKQPGGKGREGREGRCSDNLYYYHSWVSYGGCEGLQCSSWLPFVLKTASATSTNSNRNNNNKSSQTQNHNWSGRQADSLQAGYLPTYLPTINCYLRAQRLLPTNSFCSFTTTTTPVAWNFLNNKNIRNNYNKKKFQKFQKFHNWSSCSSSFSLGVKFRQNLKNKEGNTLSHYLAKFSKKKNFGHLIWTLIFIR